jgi:drug/metabolite transporter (DMT)-like permease
VSNFILLISLVLTQVLGDIGLSRGMKDFGEANPLNLLGLAKLIIYLLTNPWIWLGVTILIISLFLYLAAVSRLDLSYVLPVHSSSYVVNALLAWLLLGEQVSVLRWLAAVLISLGVCIVGFSNHPSTRSNLKRMLVRLKKIWLQRSLFFLLPLSFSLSKVWLAILIIAISDACGDLFTARGMKQIGAMKLTSLSQTLEEGFKIITNIWIIQGITCQAIAFLGFVSALSWADISLVRPGTALTYVLSLLGAALILKEKVDFGRLLGIICVGIGILIISFD